MGPTPQVPREEPEDPNEDRDQDEWVEPERPEDVTVQQGVR